MRHLQVGRKFDIDSSHRTALFRSLTLALIEKEAIRTTRAKAKELRWFADRVVTLAKRGDLHSRRQLVRLLGSTQTGKSGQNRVRLAMERLYQELVPRFKTRPGGYTQILRFADRRPGDNAEMCLMRYLPAPEPEKGKKVKGKAAEAKGKKSSKEAAAEVAAPKKSKKSSEPQDKPTKAKEKEKAE